MCIIFSFSMYYVYGEAVIDEKLVELEFTTLMDFTVQADIPLEVYQQYMSYGEGEKSLQGFK